MRYPGPVSGMHQTRAGVRLVTLPNAVRDTRGPRVAYRLAASSRYSASSSALAALSTWPVPSQRAVDDQDPRIYMRIAADIRARIEADELKPGQPAPSITSLRQELGVARETAAHALQVLEAEALVRRYPGRGYYVVPR
jgi:hypothetical protein